MSSSTKSESKEKERKNNPKGEIPNKSSEKKDNSKGAVPKTKTGKVTSVTEASQRLQLSDKTGLKDLKMNASEPNHGDGTAARKSTEKKENNPEKKHNSKGAVPKTKTEKVTSVTEANQKLLRPVKSGLKDLKMNASGPNHGDGTAARKITEKKENNTEKKDKSKGAVPKTKTEKVTSVTEAKQKLLLPVKSALKVLIMNASGPNHGEGTAARRKEAIQNVIKRNEPDLVLFQEFAWKEIHGETWSDYPVPDHFQLTTNHDASILYNIRKVITEEKPRKEIERILQELQRSTSKHPTPISLDFAPISRMSLRVVKTKGVPVMEFICISWHGKHAGMSDDKKVTEFTYLMIFLQEIYKKYKLPILIAGDFNVEMKLIHDEVKEPFQLYKYKAFKRREDKGVIDYFIATTELHLYNIRPVDIREVSEADKPEDVLDHDPIKAMLKPAPQSDTVLALNKAASRMQQKTK